MWYNTPRRLFEYNQRGIALKYIIGALFAVAIVLLIINIVDLNRYVKRNIVIYDEKVKKRLKICFVSDLHNYSCTPSFYDDIKEFNPDIILCGGDTITAVSGKKQDNAYLFLEKLSKIAPVYTAHGNHEYRAKIYPADYGEMYNEFYSKIKEYGITLLANNSALFDEYNVEVTSVDIEASYYKKFKVMKMPEGYIESLLGKPDLTKYNILLAHNPDYFESYNEYKADLIMSGHLHGGLI